MPTNSAGRNHKRTKESSLFGTRKLAFYTVTSGTGNNLVGSFTSGYSFRVSMLTGLVTFDADITALGTDHMSLDFQGQNGDDLDDEAYQLALPFDIDFLGGGTTADQVYVNSNGGLSFYTNSADHPDPDSAGNGGAKQILIAANDANVQFIYLDSSTPGQYRVKVRGNTDYTNDGTVNFQWEALFREGETYIDFIVTAQPTDWNAYNDGQGNVTWGVTDGSTWVDGRTASERATSFAPFVSAAEELWRLPNSTYYKVVQAIQQSGAELYWLGTPHNAAEPFTVDWSALTISDSADSFMFAIADDADAPVANLENTVVATAVATATAMENSVDLDGNPSNVYKGQRVVFSGTTIGGLVAGKNYYVANTGTYDSGNKKWIAVSETADPEVLDIVYPSIVGGEPGTEFVTTTDTGTMTVTFYNYTVEWGGTAGDIQSSCCNNLTEPGIVPARLSYFIGESGALLSNDPDQYWWITRSNPTFGIFPAFVINENI